MPVISPRLAENVVTVLPYATVAAGQTDSILGATGNANDYISHVLIVPAAAACGSVVLKDGNTAITIFAGGATVNLPTLAPIAIPLGMRSINGGWKITTGANVSVIAMGDFT